MHKIPAIDSGVWREKAKFIWQSKLHYATIISINLKTLSQALIVYEFKAKGKDRQYQAIDEAIRSYKFIRNSCLRYWMDNNKVSKYDLNKYCKILAKQFSWANKLNSQSRQSAAECTWSAISKFYENCKRKSPGNIGFPRFKKHARSVEYKATGWKLSDNRKAITFTDKNNIGKLKLIGTYDLHFYPLEDIKRVRLVRRADGYYVQFCISVDVRIETEPTGKAIGLDVGIKYFLADSDGNTILNPQFYRKAEKQLNRANRRTSRKYTRGATRQSKNYHKARNRYERKHLRVSRQRKEYCKRVAYCVIHSNDVVAYEDLNVKGMVKKRCDPPSPLLAGSAAISAGEATPTQAAKERAPRDRSLAQSISDVAWSTFRHWLEYFGIKYGKLTIPVAPYNTSQNCSNCGEKVNKSLSTRTHICHHCGYVEDRDVNAAKNILRYALSTVGQTGSLKLREFAPLSMLEQSCIGKCEQ